MKKPALLIFFALAAACGVYLAYYTLATRQTRALVSAQDGEMEWVRREFRLSDAQFERVKVLHDAYEPQCMELCRKISEANAALDRLIRTSNGITPEIKAAMARCTAVQLECHQAMLEHIYRVSNCMAPEDALRYRTMMESRILQPPLHSSRVEM